MKALVMATCRPEEFEKWEHKWAEILARNEISLYVMVDTDQEAFVQRVKRSARFASVFSHADVSRSLKGKAWIIPKGTSACKSFAILKAWQHKAETIYCLDDDCYPVGEVFFRDHDRHLKQRTINPIASTITGTRPRGMPYVDPVQVMVNHGGWLGVPDIDAVTQLAGYDHHSMNEGLVTSGCLFPFSGMNWACRREAVPMMYFGLQGAKWGVDRFDDIWCGFVAKRICDHLGWGIHTGDPCIEHIRASNPLVNIEKEAHGYGMNVDFYRFCMKLDPAQFNVIDCMKHAGTCIRNWGKATDRDGQYWQKYGEAIQIWASLFKEG